MHKKRWLIVYMAIVSMMILFAGYVLADEEEVEIQIINEILASAQKGEINGQNGGVDFRDLIEQSGGTEQKITIPYLAFDKEKVENILKAHSWEGDFLFDGGKIKLGGKTYAIGLGITDDEVAYADEESMHFNLENKSLSDAGVNFGEEYHKDQGATWNPESTYVVTFITAAADELIYEDDMKWGTKDEGRQVFLEGYSEGVIVASEVRASGSTRVVTSLSIASFGTTPPDEEDEVPILDLNREQTGTIETPAEFQSSPSDEYKFLQFGVAQSGQYRVRLYDRETRETYSPTLEYDGTGWTFQNLFYKKIGEAFSAIGGLDYGENGSVLSGVFLQDNIYGIKVPADKNLVIELERIDDEDFDPEGVYLLSDLAARETFLHEEADEAEWYEKIISWLIRGLAKGAQTLLALIAGEELSIDRLVFDQYTRTQLTFFERDIDSSYYDDYNPLLKGAIENGSISSIYSGFQKIAIASYMVILVYMGIRILVVSTNANKKAQYKDIFFYWVKGIVILFLFPYVIRFTMLVNRAFVSYLYNSKEVAIESGGGVNAVSVKLEAVDDVDVSESTKAGYMQEMYEQARQSKRIADAICFAIMVMQTFQFLIVYMKRLITITFLICIFPLVTITYAVDRVGDGKAQAFNNWFKEFFLQVFIQSFHAVNYVLIMQIILGFDTRGGNWFLKIAGIVYIAKGGDIIKGLFAQMKGGAGKAGGPMTVATSLMKTKLAIEGVKKIRGLASKTFGSQSMFGRGIGKFADLNNRRLNWQAANATVKAREAYDNAVTNSVATMATVQAFDAATSGAGSYVGGTPSVDTSEETRANDKKLQEAAKFLNTLSLEELNEAIYRGGLSDEQVKYLEDVLTTAAAYDVLRNRKVHTTAEVKTATDLVINMKRNPTEGSKRYMDALGEKDFTDGELRKISKTNSIALNTSRKDDLSITGKEFSILGGDISEETATVRRSMRRIRSGDYSEADLEHDWKVVLEASENERLRGVVEYESVHNATDRFTADDFEAEKSRKEFERTKDALDHVKEAHKGVHTEGELQHYLAILEKSKENDVLKDYIEWYEREKLNYTVEDFKLNLAVQTVNEIHPGTYEGSGIIQDKMDSAIREIQARSGDAGSRDILAELKANQEELEIGKMPLIHYDGTERRKLQAEIEKKMQHIEELRDISDEEVAYWKNMKEELKKGMIHDAVTGTTDVIVGGILGTYRAGFATAAGATTLGATVSGKKDKDVLEEILAIVPTAMSSAEAFAHKQEDIVDNVIGGVESRYTPAGESMRVIQGSMDRAVGYYADEAESRRTMSESERERQITLEKINREAGKRGL